MRLLFASEREERRFALALFNCTHRTLTRPNTITQTKAKSTCSEIMKTMTLKTQIHLELLRKQPKVSPETQEITMASPGPTINGGTSAITSFMLKMTNTPRTSGMTNGGRLPSVAGKAMNLVTEITAPVMALMNGGLFTLTINQSAGSLMSILDKTGARGMDMNLFATPVSQFVNSAAMTSLVLPATANKVEDFQLRKALIRAAPTDSRLASPVRQVRGETTLHLSLELTPNKTMSVHLGATKVENLEKVVDPQVIRMIHLMTTDKSPKMKNPMISPTTTQFGDEPVLLSRRRRSAS